MYKIAFFIFIFTNDAFYAQGPAEKPGIFIQSTKAGRLAREAGLRPGDQIMECNGVSFRSIEFGDAVFHLKSSRQVVPQKVPSEGS